MKLIVTAIVPQSLVDGIITKLVDVFDGEFIAESRQGLSAGVLSKNQVYCFSGSFLQEELDRLNTLGLALPGVVFWVQDSATGQVVASSRANDVGSVLSPKQLVRAAGVTFPRAVEQSVGIP
jgi:hypothetical protein